MADDAEAAPEPGQEDSTDEAPAADGADGEAVDEAADEGNDDKKGGKKKKGKKGKKGKQAEEMTQEEAATKIQSAVRGKAGRKKHAGKASAKKKKAVIELIMAMETVAEEVRAELEGLELKELRKRAKAEGVDKAEVERVAPRPKGDKAHHKAQKSAKKKAKAVNELRKNAAKEVAGLMGGKGAFVREEGRGCTDCLFCLLFIAYWGLMCYLILFALEHGDIDRLIKPRDMEMNSCGLKTGDVDMTAYSQLYLPNPANDKIQICVDGCPGGSTGTCTGNETRNYMIVDGREIDTGSAGATMGALSALAGLQLPGPDKYEREGTCVEMGDCSNGDADVLQTDCTKVGRCLNGTDVMFESLEQRKCQYNTITLAETGYTFEPFEWTGYDWAHNEDDGLFICLPKEMAAAPDDPTYPPTDFLEANIKGWLGADGPCWMPVFPSKDVLFRCVPLMLKDMVNPEKLGETAQGQQVVQFMTDVKKYWKVIPLGACVAVLIAFAWIVFLSKFAGLLIWSSVYGIEILLPLISGACWWQLGFVDTRLCKATAVDAVGTPLDATLGALCAAADISMSPELYSYAGTAEANCQAASCLLAETLGETCEYEQDACTYTSGIYMEIPPEMQEEMAKANTSEEYTYNVAVGSLIVWAVLGVIFIIFSGRIHIAIGVIEEASDAFLDIPTVVLFPIIVLLISIPVSAFCCFACFMLMSLRSVDPATGAMTYCLDPTVAEIAYPGQGDPDCVILKGMMFAQVFGWLWTVQWFSSIQYTSVAGAISRWYFTPTMDSNADGKETKDTSHFLLFDSILRTMCHHLGTMALGSFITAVVITVKYVAVYTITQIQAQSPENKVIQFLGNCLKVVIGCVERFIRFLGHIAYIETAIYGTNFCRSVVKAFIRLVKNVIRFSFVTLFSKLVLLLGKLLTIGGAVWLAILSIAFIYPKDEDENALPGAIPVAPAILVGFFAATIAIAIMGIYETAIDTILVSFLEDEAENDDNGNITFASGELSQFMSGTKSIADAEEAYTNATMDAKTSRIRSNNESEKQLLEGSKQSHGAKQARKGKKKGAKKGKKKGGKDGEPREKDLAGDGGGDGGDEV